MATPPLATPQDALLTNKQPPKSSVLRSFIHKRSPSEGSYLQPPPSTDHSPLGISFDFSDDMLAPGRSRTFGDMSQNLHNNQPPSSPKKSSDSKRPPLTNNNGMRSLHKKTLSSISLKSLAGKDTVKEDKPKKPKKSKSSNNFVVLLSRPRSSKNLAKAAEESARILKDKENNPPYVSPPIETFEQPPPIFAQFQSQSPSVDPLGGKFLEEEIHLYTPDQYSPSKQRVSADYFNCQPPSPTKVYHQRKPRLNLGPGSVPGQEPILRTSSGVYSIDEPHRTPRPGYIRSSTSITSSPSASPRPSFDRRTTSSSAFGTPRSSFERRGLAAEIKSGQIRPSFERRSTLGSPASSPALSPSPDFAFPTYADVLRPGFQRKPSPTLGVPAARELTPPIFERGYSPSLVVPTTPELPRPNFERRSSPSLVVPTTPEISRPNFERRSSPSLVVPISPEISRPSFERGPEFSPKKASYTRPSDERKALPLSPVKSEDKNLSLERKVTASPSKTDEPRETLSKRGSRVMAAVAAFTMRGGPSKEEKANSDKGVPEKAPSHKDVDAELEAMLDRRNIPENHRHKMRSLALSMKKDLIRQDYAEAAAAKQAANANLDTRPDTRSSDSSSNESQHSNNGGSVKRPRPLSKTFTLSKAPRDSSPTKKQKPEGTVGRHSRKKSADSGYATGTRSSSSTGSVTSTIIAKAKGQHPDDFVAYMRKVRKPELVEVGKLHKLRLLLRNETVCWTETFITLGGMSEMVGLLHRTMEVEWREEHEDALLHEILLCLKALCTTALALRRLSEIQHTLFPALLGMLFDEEKKGPSEFTTRHLITELLFTWLKSASLHERTPRARLLLTYLRDPEPKEEERPVNFVLEMRRERPYRVWCKEVSNVTKEVFWIFLHNLNVIALPSSSDSNGYTSNDSVQAAMNALEANRQDVRFSYLQANFPTDRPPVPAAPYVGGVEWDATNYLASHLDLLNGILACLPTRAERNQLREQFRMSGWEKCMGGTMRLCKEKFYAGVHAGLRTWVAAGIADCWDVSDVRCGPRQENKSPVKKTPRKKVEVAPQLEMPKLDFGKRTEREDEWL